MDWIQPVVVTMLGAPRSGKTTFLVGMYAKMSLGEGAYSLVERDQDKDFELGRAWERLLREGVLPPPTPEEPHHYLFTLAHGITPLLQLSWTDFRGGAMSTPLKPEGADAFVDGADARELIDRLAVSDSVYLVLDGSRLDLAAGPEGQPAELAARRMTALLRAALLRREPGRPLPSVLVLLTKTDRLLHGLPSRAATTERLDRALELVCELLPVIRQPGLTAAVCPVTVGRFGDQEQGVVDPETVRPYWLHKPVLFTAFHRLGVELVRLDAELGRMQERHQRVRTELTRLTGDRMGRLFHRGEIRRLTDEQGALWQAWNAVNERRRAVGYWRSWLREEVEELPVFQGGRRLRAEEL